MCDVPCLDFLEHVLEKSFITYLFKYHNLFNKVQAKQWNKSQKFALLCDKQLRFQSLLRVANANQNVVCAYFLTISMHTDFYG